MDQCFEHQEHVKNINKKDKCKNCGLLRDYYEIGGTFEQLCASVVTCRTVQCRFGLFRAEVINQKHVQGHTHWDEKGNDNTSS